MASVRREGLTLAITTCVWVYVTRKEQGKQEKELFSGELANDGFAGTDDLSLTDIYPG